MVPAIPRPRAISPAAISPGSEFDSIAVVYTLASIAMGKGRPMKAAAHSASDRYECVSAREGRIRASSLHNDTLAPTLPAKNFFSPFALLR